MKPYFSLILPCYNVAQYLERCVLSILSQDFDACEIILVDDGSTDETPALCDAMAAENACIRVIHKPNGGLASARNAGLDAAEGRYIWFVDSDDWIEKGSLALLYQHCSDGEPDVIKFNHYRVDVVAEEVRCNVMPGLYQGENLEKLRRRAFSAAGKYVLSACLHVYRRELLKAHDLRFVSERQVGSEDYLFNLQALLHIRQLKMLDSPLYSYERRSGSLTQTYKPDLAQRYVKLKELLVDYYRAQQVLERYDRFIDRFFVWHLIIGTCVTQEYGTLSSGRTMQDARRGVRGLLRMKEVQHGARRSDRSGLPWKKKGLLLAVRLWMEPLFYWLYAVKPGR